MLFFPCNFKLNSLRYSTMTVASAKFHSPSMFDNSGCVQFFSFRNISITSPSSKIFSYKKQYLEQIKNRRRAEFSHRLPTSDFRYSFLHENRSIFDYYFWKFKQVIFSEIIFFLKFDNFHFNAMIFPWIFIYSFNTFMLNFDRI